MANIITSVPKYSASVIRDARADMVKKGLENKQITERKRHFQAAKEAKELKGKKNKALNDARPVAVMPAWEYFRLISIYGEQEVMSDEFLRYYNKKFPELSPNNA